VKNLIILSFRVGSLVSKCAGLPTLDLSGQLSREFAFRSFAYMLDAWKNLDNRFFQTEVWIDSTPQIQTLTSEKIKESGCPLFSAKIELIPVDFLKSTPQTARGRHPIPNLNIMGERNHFCFVNVPGCSGKLGSLPDSEAIPILCFNIESLPPDGKLFTDFDINLS
jgi:hypothetical protein